MIQHSNKEQSFWQKSNDLQARAWPYRLNRFVRARLYNFCAKLMWLAEEPRALAAWKHGWDPDHYIRLRRWHDEGFRPQIVYDIGAHAGGWSEMCQSIFRPRQCFLFEPLPEYQQKACARQPRQDADWQIMPFALGDTEQVNQMFVTQNNAASSMLAPIPGEVPSEWGTEVVGQQKVEVVTLDGLAARKALPSPDLVKIDVQGYEGRVIDGGKSVLSKAQRIIVEVSLRPLYSEQALLWDVLNTITGWGFELEDMTETCREWAGRLWQTDLWLKRKP
ncbi:MAG: FkbM family methyltransferase [Verrucomicrobia bacterium]|nr:FkbM family methyltransferase [Verrucomicrobiota bacterium]